MKHKGRAPEPERPAGEREKAYFNVSAPRALMMRLETLVNKHPELGYTSPSAAAVEGIRRFLLELEEKIAIGKKVDAISEIPLRMREQFAHEMLLMAQRYLDKEKQTPQDAKKGPSEDR